MENGTYHITKSTVECYKLRHSSGMYWADITIDANGETGRIQIASDFGSWQYYWGHCGCPFKQFLMKIGIDYAAGKFREDRWFDIDKTIRSFKRFVLEQRRTDDIPAAVARIIFDEIETLKDCSTNHELYHMINDECPALLQLYHSMPDACTSISPSFRKFWQMVWPEFLKTLKAEIPELCG